MDYHLSITIPVLVAVVGAIVHLVGGRGASLGLYAFAAGLLVALMHAA